MGILQPARAGPPIELLASIGMLLLGALISAVFTWFTYQGERLSHQRQVLASATLRAEKIGSSLAHLADTALQITSRTRIREELERYLRGERSLDSLRNFTAPKLADPMRLRPDILGITRIAADGAVIAQLGEALHPDTWKGHPAPQGGPQLAFRGHNPARLAVRAPLAGTDGRHLGTDNLLFDDRDLDLALQALVNELIPAGSGILVATTGAERLVQYRHRHGTPPAATVTPALLDTWIGAAGAEPAYIEGAAAVFVVPVPVDFVRLHLVMHADDRALFAGARAAAGRSAALSLSLTATAALLLFTLLRRLGRRLHALEDEHIDLEKQADEQRVLMEQIIDNTPSVIYVKDADGRYKLVNRAYEELLSRPRAEMIGRQDTDFFPPETASQLRENDLLLLGSGEPGEFDECVQLPDGIRHYLAVKFPQRDADGNVTGICGISTDITDRRNSEVRLQEAAAFFEQAREGMLIASPEGDILDINPAMCHLMGGKREQFLGRNPRIWKSDRHTDAFYRALWAQCTTSGHWRGEIWNRLPGQADRPFLLSISAVRDTRGNILRFVANYTDIRAQIDVQRQMEYLAHHDPLTDLPNRAKFSIQAEMVLARALRNRRHFALAYIDLDGFKPINDELGHDAGDEVLRMAAGRLRAAVRNNDVVARVGGDEFTLLFEDVAHRSAITGLLDKIIEAFATPFLVEGRQVRTTPSVGVSIYPEDGDTVAELLRNADQAMYRAKSAGRNRYTFHAE